jgi:hypothetical protein
LIGPDLHVSFTRFDVRRKFNTGPEGEHLCCRGLVRIGTEEVRFDSDFYLAYFSEKEVRLRYFTAELKTDKTVWTNLTDAKFNRENIGKAWERTSGTWRYREFVRHVQLRLGLL